MAILFFGVDGPTINLRKDLQIANTDAPRILGYLMSSSFGSVTENVQSEVPDESWVPGEGQTEDDRPTILTQEWVTRPATPGEAASNYARSVLDSLLAQTVTWEKATAMAQAAANVSTIAVTE
jgi:hypothetical protein